MRVLLIVDDEPLSLRAVSRLMRGSFDEILTAQTVDEAETLLENNTVSHLLCDRCLNETKRGEELIDKWRGLWPAITYAALMTGEDVETLEVPQSVDAVFPKPFNVALLRKSFGQ